MASGTDRHLDVGLQVVEAHPLFPYFLEKRLAIPTSPFFHLLVNGFSVIYIVDQKKIESYFSDRLTFFKHSG